MLLLGFMLFRELFFDPMKDLEPKKLCLNWDYFEVIGVLFAVL